MGPVPAGPQKVPGVWETAEGGPEEQEASPNTALGRGEGLGQSWEGKGSYLHYLPQVVHVRFLCLHQFTEDIPGERTGLATSSLLG